MSAARVTLALPDGTVLQVEVEGSTGMTARALGTCPGCRASPFGVRGAGMCVEGPSGERRDTYAARASCTACGAPCGVLRAVVSTLFGIDEDNAVLCGRPRVY